MIDVDQLSYTYPGSNAPAVCDLHFNIEKGEVFGFLGPSGSGKSTTQKLLFKLLPGYTGTACIDQREVRDWGPDLYEKIGVSFELPNHYLKLTALENLKFFSDFYPRSLDPMTLLERVGLHEDANKRVGDYSKGMKMRLNFIRAYLHDPEVLFLDEPTSGLDPVNAKLVKDIILELKAAGKTIFLTTHQMHDAEQLCDRVAFIVDGKIKLIAQPEQLKLEHSEHTVEVLFEDNEEKITFPLDNLGQNADFLHQLQNRKITSIHSKEASLNDIFIKITGKTLEQ